MAKLERVWERTDPSILDRPEGQRARALVHLQARLLPSDPPRTVCGEAVVVRDHGATAPRAAITLGDPAPLLMRLRGHHLTMDVP